MALHEHRCVELDRELLGKIRDPLGLMFTSAVGQEDEGDLVGLKEVERL